MVKDGYKQTDIGVIPEDWKVSKLGNISFITKLAGFEYTNHFNSYKDGGEIIVVRGTNITNNKLDLTDIKKIPKKVSNYLVRSKLSKGDLVFAYVGTIGPIFLIDKNDTYHLGPNTCKITLDKLINNNYILSYFKSWLIKSEIKEHTSIGAQPSLSMTKIRNFNIVLPPIEEQKAIATVLSDTDELINSLEKLISKKEAIKTATMQQLLTGKKRLDGFSREWEEKKLGDIVEVISGGTPSTSIQGYWNGDIDWYTPTEIGKDKYISQSNRKITADGLYNSSAKILPIGTILLTSRAGIGDTSILMSKGCTNQGFQSLIAKKNIDYEFLYYLVNIMTSKFLQNASGSTFLEISPNQVKQIDIIIPSNNKEQKAISTILSDMDKELESLKVKLSKTKAIKEGMMQELLTGKTRLINKQEKQNKHFENAVIIGVLAKQFATENFPLGRMRYTKISYLLHRQQQHSTRDYLKKAAGPYNPQTKYRGAENIALTKGYIKQHKIKKYQGFVADKNITEATNYFTKWFGCDIYDWIEQFRYLTNDKLELLATIDMAIEDLKTQNKKINLQNVKYILQSSKEWKQKLKRDIFSDDKIEEAMQKVKSLFGQNI